MHTCNTHNHKNHKSIQNIRLIRNMHWLIKNMHRKNKLSSSLGAVELQLCRHCLDIRARNCIIIANKPLPAASAIAIPSRRDWASLPLPTTPAIF